MGVLHLPVQVAILTTLDLLKTLLLQVKYPQRRLPGTLRICYFSINIITQEYHEVIEFHQEVILGVIPDQFVQLLWLGLLLLDSIPVLSYKFKEPVRYLDVLLKIARGDSLEHQLRETLTQSNQKMVRRVFQLPLIEVGNCMRESSEIECQVLGLEDLIVLRDHRIDALEYLFWVHRVILHTRQCESVDSPSIFF